MIASAVWKFWSVFSTVYTYIYIYIHTRTHLYIYRYMYIYTYSIHIPTSNSARTLVSQKGSPRTYRFWVNQTNSPTFSFKVWSLKNLLLLFFMTRWNSPQNFLQSIPVVTLKSIPSPGFFYKSSTTMKREKKTTFFNGKVSPCSSESCSRILPRSTFETSTPGCSGRSEKVTLPKTSWKYELWGPYFWMTTESSLCVCGLFSRWIRYISIYTYHFLGGGR